MILLTIIHLFLIPFILLFYPVYVLFMAFINPFYMPKEIRCLCFCKHLSMIVDKCCFTCCLFTFSVPFIFILGIFIGVINVLVFIVPAFIYKLYKLISMIIFWRCYCCLNKHSDWFIFIIKLYIFIFNKTKVLRVNEILIIYLYICISLYIS
jgi:hypothetical protein